MAVSFTAPSGESDSEEGSEAETPSCSFVAPSGLTGAAPRTRGAGTCSCLAFNYHHRSCTVASYQGGAGIPIHALASADTDSDAEGDEASSRPQWIRANSPVVRALTPPELALAALTLSHQQRCKARPFSAAH